MRMMDALISRQVYIIAEMSANHAGKLENALEIVRAAKEVGADCIKIQTYTADTMTLDCNNDYFRINNGLWNGYRYYDLYNEAYTPWQWQPIIKAECDKIGIDFLSTPFDSTAVDFLEDLNVSAYKIASFELVDIPLIEYTASKGKPMIISCGMGSIEEIQDAVDACRRNSNNQIILLKCCSEYPANYADMRLANIYDMKERFGVHVGLSDHSMGGIASIVGVSLGACVIEKHFCLSRSIKNPDSEFSMEPQEFSQMVKDIKAAIEIKGVVNYDLTDKEKESTIFRRSLFAARDIENGETFTNENIRVVRPGNGMKPKYINDVLGKKASQDILFGTPIIFEMLTDKKYTSQVHIKQNVYLRRAEYYDARILFDWANDATVRNNGFSGNVIKWEEHIRWFEGKLNSNDTFLYILMLDNQAVGQIRYDIDNEKAMVSYSIGNNWRNRGLGRKIIEMGCERIKIDAPMVKKLIARVKPDNEPSKRVLKSQGYEDVFIELHKDVCSFENM